MGSTKKRTICNFRYFLRFNALLSGWVRDAIAVDKKSCVILHFLFHLQAAFLSIDFH